jgi:hypothetical protein
MSRERRERCCEEKRCLVWYAEQILETDRQTEERELL